MLARFFSFVSSCWRAASAGYSSDVQRDLLFSQDSSRHHYGEFSAASLQANQLNEDCLLIEPSTPFGGVFVGVYDGHGGPEASHFVKERLFTHLARFANEMGGMSMNALRMAFSATEREFETLVAESWPTNPQLAAVGSCCLVGVVCDGNLYVANLGDSRAVLGTVYKTTGAATAMQLTSEHNVGIEAVREELKSLHPDDSHIVLLRHGVWRVKGIIQVSRSIGDLYLKRQEFNREPLYAKFRISEPLLRPVITSEPTVSVHEIQPNDRFLIFASDGLWEHLSNEEAVEIVNNNPKRGVARKLIKAALLEAAKKREVRYTDLKKIQKGVRRHFHDDITVVVLFLDQELLRRNTSTGTVMPVGMMDSHTAANGQHRQGWNTNGDCDITETRSILI